MATYGINANVQKVKWRIVADSVQSGLVSDIWDQTSQVLTSLEFPRVKIRQVLIVSRSWSENCSSVS